MSLDGFCAAVDEVEAAINPITLVTPTNKNEVKSGFVETGSIGAFSYRACPDADPIVRELDRLRSRLASLPDELRDVSAGVLAALRTKLDMVAALGTAGMREASSALYGEPTEASFEAARAFLARTRDSPRPDHLVGAEEVARRLEAALVRYGLANWRVLLDDREITAVIHSERLVAIPREKRFAPDHARRLAVHEVGVHVLRAENGGGQPFALLGVGLPGFYETEEGLAVFSEVALGTVSMFTLRQYALRLVAVRDALSGASMIDACRRLRDEHGLSDAQSFDVAFRAYRGGGLIKDHIYFQGYLAVRDFARTHSLEELYVGKIGIADLPRIAELRARGWVRDARLLPDPEPRWNALVENL